MFSANSSILSYRRFPQPVFKIFAIALLAILAGCGFHLRGTDITAIAPGDYTVKIDSAFPELQFELMKMFRKNGFQLVENDEDFQLKILAESSNLDELTPDAELAISLKSLVYQIRYTIVTGDDTVVLGSTLYSSSSEYQLLENYELASDANKELLNERFRVKAAQELAYRFSMVVSGYLK